MKPVIVVVVALGTTDVITGEGPEATIPRPPFSKIELPDQVMGKKGCWLSIQRPYPLCATQLLLMAPARAHAVDARAAVAEAHESRAQADEVVGHPAERRLQTRRIALETTRA
jgi:hypothetical protein